VTTAHDPCAMCERYTLNRPNLPAGHGWCTAWERVTPWDGQIGVLFKEARDRAPRARYVAQQQAQQQELEKA
jgi:hypothetical protein